MSDFFTHSSILFLAIAWICNALSLKRLWSVQRSQRNFQVKDMWTHPNSFWVESDGCSASPNEELPLGTLSEVNSSLNCASGGFPLQSARSTDSGLNKQALEGRNENGL